MSDAPVSPSALTVHLYALVWNERALLPFFLEHYRPFVDRFFLFDDGSDDGSVEYLTAQPDVELVSLRHEGSSFVKAAQTFSQEAWKASRGQADFVAVVNIDEFIYHPDPLTALREARAAGLTVLQTRGWDMVSETFPSVGPLAKTVTRGVHSPSMAKTGFFDPNAIEDMGFAVGRHSAAPSGRVLRTARPWFDLLHYKFLGEDYLVSRYRELAARMRTGDMAAGYGKQYSQEEGLLKARFARLLQAASPVLIEQMETEGLLSRPLPGVVVRSLKDGRNARGGLQEVWRNDDPLGVQAAQVYVTTTLPGVVKAWYGHRRQTDQIFVLSGAIRLVLWNPGGNAGEQGPVEILMEAESPRLVVIPPLVWHGFQALGPEPAVIVHMNNRAFDWGDTDEERLAPDDPGVPWRWLAPEDARVQP